MHRAHARYAAEADRDGELIARHGDLIARAAGRIAARTAGAVQPEDLWSAGALGLVEAARRFDAAQNVRFETFAEHRVRGAMLDELRRLDHLPRRLRAQAEEVLRARERLAQALGQEPSTEALCEAVGLPGEEVGALLALGAPPDDALDGLLGAHLAADEQLERAQLARKLAEAVASLPPRLQTLLGLHYEEGLTYREIAGILGVSEPRVCQLHREAAAKLRALLEERT